MCSDIENVPTQLQILLLSETLYLRSRSRVELLSAHDCRVWASVTHFVDLFANTRLTYFALLDNNAAEIDGTKRGR